MRSSGLSKKRIKTVCASIIYVTAVSERSTASVESFLETVGQWFYRTSSMTVPFFHDLAEHRSCQEMFWGRSEMKERLTCQILMGYETLMLLVLRWPLDVPSGDARTLGAIGLKRQRWRDNQPQKRRFPGRD